jgi:hypothetical protein
VRKSPACIGFCIVAAVSWIAEPAFGQSTFPGIPIPDQLGAVPDLPHPLMLGSAPTPTPDDLCARGSTQQHCYTDSSKKDRRHFIADPAWPGHFREIRPGDEKIIEHLISTQHLMNYQKFQLGQ